MQAGISAVLSFHILTDRMSRSAFKGDVTEEWNLYFSFPTGLTIANGQLQGELELEVEGTSLLSTYSVKIQDGSLVIVRESGTYAHRSSVASTCP